MPAMDGTTVSDLLRRIEQLARYGTIAEVNHAQARCRVRSGGLLSQWVPWLTHRAGTTTTWSPPTVGEQCLLLSPGGHSAGAVALLGLYSTAVPSPSAAPDLHTAHFPDGAVISYDQAAHALVASLPAGSSATLTATTVTVHSTDVTVNASNSATLNTATATCNASGSATLTTPETTINGHVTLNGSMDASGDVTAGGISLIHHVHGGVTPGPGTTGQPQ